MRYYSSIGIRTFFSLFMVLDLLFGKIATINAVFGDMHWDGGVDPGFQT